MEVSHLWAITSLGPSVVFGPDWWYGVALIIGMGVILWEIVR